MLSGLGNLGGMFKQAKELQERMSDVQKELIASRYQGEAGAGAVVVTVDGKGTVVDGEIRV